MSTKLSPRPALFLDRDGVLNVDRGYVGAREDFVWIPGAREAVRRANAHGLVFVVTNQSGIGRGLYTEADFLSLMDWMLAEIRAAGGRIDDFRYCPYHPEAILARYRKVSDWRKPAPGMILDLMRAYQLAPEHCLMIGDKPSDAEAASRAGIRYAHFQGGNLDTFLAPLLQAPSCN